MDTNGKLRGRAAARKLVTQRKSLVDAEERKRYEQETDLAADYLLACEDRQGAREALRRSEAKIGRVIASMVDELGVSYARLVALFDESEQELKRLRKVATDEDRQRPPAQRPPARGAMRTPIEPASVPASTSMSGGGQGVPVESATR